ncbi:MAG: YifB family Mg chelatase-like AAA ATPase [Proteobacteria bacterium]|nr:YifB family Mg chelatase-like AAA ATPase [Pseudomonadota bacterium]
MSMALIYSRANSGIEAVSVTIEAHISNGLPHLAIVGLAETTVKESKDRVRSALLNSHFEFPVRRVTINLAPADLPKYGGRFDLPIALGILAASGQIPIQALDQYEFAGELALNGSLRAISGVVPFAIATRSTGRKLVIPTENAEEASLVTGIEILPVKHLLDICAHLKGNPLIIPYSIKAFADIEVSYPDLSEVYGQYNAKRGLEIAATGCHSLLLMGPPGTGKTLLASRLPSILPDMTEAEALESAAIGSISIHAFTRSEWRKRPFRAPHHTASNVALVGGGNPPKPGEVSLAHNGILFLDELPEFSRRTLETLREPLESGHIVISRATMQIDFPAKFQFIAAMNPCPCGHLGNPHIECCCSGDQIQRYRARLSGPLLDRIDCHIEVPTVVHEVFNQKKQGIQETSAVVKKRVEIVREKQLARAGKCNSELNNQEIKKYCVLSEAEEQLLQQIVLKLGLSMRSYHRILRIARTIADMGQSKDIEKEHLCEAISYRLLDRKRVGSFNE